MQNYEQAAAYIAALTGQDPSTAVINFRCIHDTNKQTPAHSYDGTLPALYETLCQYNCNGYGIFANINPLDGQGRENQNVKYIRAHCVDLDNPLTAQQNYERAIASAPLPSFAVQSSPGKYHVYWCVDPYTSNEYYTIQQRKLRQLYDGDKSVIDPARVLRVPGFLHLKNPATPHMVTCHALRSYGQPLPIAALAASLEHINVIDGFGGRHDLGDPALAAPSLEWLQFALGLVDPNDLDRGEWISLTAAIKQAGWSLTDETTLQNIWLEWCARYRNDDLGENMKQWNSVRNTEVGWPSVTRRTPIQAYLQFGFTAPPAPLLPVVEQTVVMSNPVDSLQQSVLPSAVTFNPVGPDATAFSEILSEHECRQWFKDCHFIARTGEIFSPSGRFMNATKFNGQYGGKQFIITSTGKTTDEAWKAALRSTVWQIPKVDHVRFLPDRALFEIINDRIGRKGLNTYIPVKTDMRPGDVTPWLRHVEKILPVESDRRILFEFMAHAVKYPGYKIPWAILIQSSEGVGKTVFKEVLSHALGDMYVYSPKAQELVNSGSVFNAWMRGKLMIVVDEIKIDERRELIEILKPMISDARVEIQSKGVDQDMEDNPANWLFFSNYKDAVPVNKNGRRYAVSYSALQSKADILAAGMDKAYFDFLWNWLRNEGGLQMVAYWLKNYPIEKGGLSPTAPETSSHAEAVRISRSPIEVTIATNIEDGVAGFRGGFISVIACLRSIKAAGIKTPSERVIQNVLDGMGFIELGRCPRAYANEDVYNKTILYGTLSTLNREGFGRAQGYE